MIYEIMKRPAGEKITFVKKAKGREHTRQSPTSPTGTQDMLAQYTGRIEWSKGPRGPVPTQIPSLATKGYRAVKEAITGNELLNNLTGADKIINATENYVMNSGIPEPQLLQALGTTYGAFLGHWAGKKVLGPKRKTPSWLKYTPFKNEGEFIGAVIGSQLAHSLVK